jgi:uncharacterized membrane protein
MIDFKFLMLVAGDTIDGLGVAVVIIGALHASGSFLRHWREEAAYRLFRQQLAKAILLGLEFLIAGDIIRTVVVAPTLVNTGVLAIIVLIRTFLSTTLQLEVEGRWPWQAKA